MIISHSAAVLGHSFVIKVTTFWIEITGFYEKKKLKIVAQNMMNFI